MVVGKASDPYDSVYYAALGSPQAMNLSADYPKFLKEYGYVKSDSLHAPTVLLTDNLDHDSVKALKAFNPQVSKSLHTNPSNPDCNANRTALYKPRRMRLLILLFR
jgi:hypothetical protein